MARISSETVEFPESADGQPRRQSFFHGLGTDDVIVGTRDENGGDFSVEWWTDGTEAIELQAAGHGVLRVRVTVIG